MNFKPSRVLHVIPHVNSENYLRRTLLDFGESFVKSSCIILRFQSSSLNVELMSLNFIARSYTLRLDIIHCVYNSRKILIYNLVKSRCPGFWESGLKENLNLAVLMSARPNSETGFLSGDVHDTNLMVGRLRKEED